MQGKSFKPLLFPDESKEDYESREYIISELTYHDHGYNPIRGLRTKKWKYIYNFTDTVAGEDRLFEIPTDISNRASGKSFIEHHPEWKHKKPQDELYDLDNDPNEFENVAEKEEYQDVRKNLREKLMGILKASNDPVLEGKVEAPADSGPILM